MNADLIAKAVGILAMIGFTSVVLGVLFVSYMLIESWTTRALPPEPSANDTLFNAFEEARKRKQNNDRSKSINS